jgi:hypothetical protein
MGMCLVWKVPILKGEESLAYSLNYCSGIMKLLQLSNAFFSTRDFWEYLVGLKYKNEGFQDVLEPLLLRTYG